MLKLAGIVRCDLKSENVMVDFDESGQISTVKLIDFGSACLFDKLNSQVELTTPEYMPPEILNYLEFKKMNFLTSDSQKVDIANKMWPWSLDVWSLGIIILDIVVGFPVWLSYKGRIVRGSLTSPVVNAGVFGVQGRIPTKIAKMQSAMASNLPGFLKKNLNRNELTIGAYYRDQQFFEFLKLILNENPRLRKAPEKILEHEFL